MKWEITFLFSVCIVYNAEKYFSAVIIDIHAFSKHVQRQNVKNGKIL